MSSRNSILLLAIILCISCSAPRVVQVTQRDSVVVRIKDSLVLHDSIVLVPIPVESSSAVLPDRDTSRLETSVATSVAYLNESGQICHTLTNKDALLPVRIVIPERIQVQERDKALIRKGVEIVEVEKEMSRWQNFIQMLGIGVLLAFAVWLIIKVRQLVI